MQILNERIVRHFTICPHVERWGEDSRTMEPRGSPKDFTRGALEDRKRLAGDSLAVDAFERECLAHLARIIHEGFVKNPGLPDE